MKRTIVPAPVPVLRARRLSVSEAKAKLSEALHSLEQGPTIVHNRGRDIAVLVGIDEYSNLVGSQLSGLGSIRGFLAAVEELKRERGGGVDFDPEEIKIQPHDPFRQRTRS
jgi:prevent-host-death family protein